ncbi:MAG TPA: hypothetical protein VLC98_09050 [Phnomibacter sp.]|nr:hypothetical protein [Phnomibacter sp.]
MDRVGRKKIYYVPGIISLIILPFLFTHFAEKEIKSNSVGVMRIFLADTNLPKKFPEVFRDFKIEFPPKRNYTDIDFTGNEKSDKIKLDYAQIKIREILSANDSVNGVHFKFSDSSKYWAFVKSIDVLRTEGAKTYMPLDNDLWFYHFPPDTTNVNFICGTNYIVLERPEINWWKKTTVLIESIWESSWQIIVLFAGFIFSVFMIKRKGNGW